MKRSSSRLKFFLITITLCLSVYLSRHFLFAACAEKLLSRITHEKFEYQTRSWEEGSLVYENVKLGEQLQAFHLRLTPDLKLSPLHLALEVYLVEPHFKVASQTPSTFNSAFLAPSKWLSVRLDIERGSFYIDEEPLGSIDLVSGTQPSHVGTVVLSDEAGSTYCNCDISFVDGQLFYQMKCESAPALYLHSFMNFFSVNSPVQLQGGTVDADLQGTLSTVQGSLTGYNLQLATSQGEIDLQRIDLKGEWSSDLSVEGSVKGGRWSHEAFSADAIEGEFSLIPQQASILTMNGQFSLGEIQGPFKCDMSGENGKLLFSGLEIPFSLQQETLFADLRNMPLTWLKGIVPFEEGLGSAQLVLSLDSKTLQLKNLQLTLVKLYDFTCNSIQGEITLQDLKTVQQAALKVENFSYQDFKNGKGEIAIAGQAFLPSILTGHWNHIPGKITWKGALSKIEGEVSAVAPLSAWSQSKIKNENSAELKALFQLQNEQLGWQGTFDVFSIKGMANLQTKEWKGEFEAPAVTLANYLPSFSEGTAEIKGTADGKTVQLNCYGKDLVLQTESELLQIPGKTDEIKIVWQSSDLTVHTTVSPSTLHLKALPVPIHLENGVLTWKEGILDIKNLQACLEETVFQGDLSYWNHPKPHLQLTSRTLEGSLRDLALFDKRIEGWEGHFKCGSEEFLLDGDLDGTAPHIHLKAYLSDLSHQFTPEMTLSSGILNLTYESIGKVAHVSGMKGTLSAGGNQFGIRVSNIDYQEGKMTFAADIPSENVVFAGDCKNEIVTLSQLQIGASKNTHPLRFTLKEQKVQGGMNVHLDSLAHYLPLIQSAGFLREVDLPVLKGSLNLEGFIAQENASLTLSSSGMTLGTLTLPALKGEIKQQKNRFETDNLVIGDIRLKGTLLHENKKWLIPEWRAFYEELQLHGTAAIDPSICLLKAKGIWKETSLSGEVIWDFKSQRGTKGLLSLEKEGLTLALSTQAFQVRDGKLEVSQLEAKASHPLLKEPLLAPLSLSWTPERLIFQGPFSQGAYQNDLFKLEGRDIQALYENGILHFQTKLQLNGAPLKAKGSFTQKGQGVVQLTEGEHQLKVTFNAFTDIAAIEGKLFGIDCTLTKKGTLFEGKVKIETSDTFATLLKKTEWSQIENLEFTGLLSTESCKGTLAGHDVLLKGYRLDNIRTSIDYAPTKFDLRDLKIDDRSGQLMVKECRGSRSHALKAWEILIPYVRGQHIQPSLLRKAGETPKEPKPFQVRQLTLTHLSGVVGRPLTFVGEGSFYFTQKEKRDPSLFDLPRAFLKEWGLDLALLSPVRGTATIELKQGKMFFHSLKDTFSDGDHSEFYLADSEPSYIDFNGELFLNLRMKQNVALKIVEPFTLSVRGTWQKPSYTLR